MKRFKKWLWGSADGDGLGDRIHPSYNFMNRMLSISIDTATRVVRSGLKWLITDEISNSLVLLAEAIACKVDITHRCEVDDLKWRIAMLEENAKRIWPPTDIQRNVDIHLDGDSSVNINLDSHKKAKCPK